MNSRQQASLGILMLDEALPADAQHLSSRPGALLNPETFDFPIITEVVEGAWATDVIRGEPALQSAFVAAAQRLAGRGAVVITADCGFTIRHQEAIADAVDVPVVSSALLLAPALLRQIPPSGKLAVITADSRHCTPDLLGLAGPGEQSRVVIAGVEGGQLMRNALSRPARSTAIDVIEKEVAECVDGLRRSSPEIRGVLLECTGFPVVASHLRRRFEIPFWDITSACKLALGSIPKDQ